MSEPQTPNESQAAPLSQINSDDRMNQALPPLPPREAVAPTRPIISIDSPNSFTLAFQQSEFFVSHAGRSPIGIYANTEVNFRTRLEESHVEDLFWKSVVLEYGPNFVREGASAELEKNVLAGVPQNLRALVYLKALHISRLMDHQTFETLLKKTKLATFADSSKNATLDVLKVFQHGIQDDHTLSAALSEAKSPANDIVHRLAELLSKVPDVQNVEQVSILTQLSTIVCRLSFEEFFYKGSRALEELNPEQFLHITKQGISLAGFFGLLLGPNLTCIPDEVALTVLDFIVFEGFDYLLRLACALFKAQQDTLENLKGDELAEYIESEAFVDLITPDVLEAACGIEIPFIKFENEFHLMSANSISGNLNELANLQDTKHDLEGRLEDLNAKLDSLRKLHEEIHSQNEEYAAKLAQAQEEKIQLKAKESAPRQKYSQLTMRENLDNTIKANEEISQENEELVKQIAALKKKVDEKRLKL